MINTGLPIPPRGNNPVTETAKTLPVGGSIDVPSSKDANYAVQAIKGFGKYRTVKRGCQRKLVNEGKNKTDVVAPGEFFWRVWRTV